MKIINYADKELLTGDDIAAAIINYASALADADKSDTVTIPTRVDTADQSATILIGPASQVVITEGDPGKTELVNQEVVDDLNERAALLGPRKPVAHGKDEHSGSIDDFPDFA